VRLADLRPVLSTGGQSSARNPLPGSLTPLELRLLAEGRSVIAAVTSILEHDEGVCVCVCVCVFCVCVYFCIYIHICVCVCVCVCVCICLSVFVCIQCALVAHLAVLPFGWEEAYTPKGEKYYIK
jgi:hypothetical protein